MSRSTVHQVKTLLSAVRQRLGMRTNAEVFTHLSALDDQVKADLAAASDGTITGLGFSPYADGMRTYGIVYTSRRGGVGTPLIPVSIEQMLNPDGLAQDIVERYRDFVAVPEETPEPDQAMPTP